MERQTCDCTQISSSEQMFGEMENRFDLIMRVDEGESPKRQNFELECEKGGERDRSEEASVDGKGSVVGTLAHDWAPLDREMQHECADGHQGTSVLLGWSRGQNGLLGDLREGLEMSGTSVVEVATAPLERSGERQAGRTAPKSAQYLQMGRIWYRRRYPKSVETQMASRTLSNSLQCGFFLLRIVGSGGSSRNLGKTYVDLVIMKTQWSHTSRHGGPSAPGELVESNQLVTSSGVEWLWWLRVASIGVERWIQVVQSETENHEVERENEREEFEDLFAPLSLLRIMVAFDTVSSWYSIGYAWSDPRMTAGVDVDVAAGRNDPRTNGAG